MDLREAVDRYANAVSNRDYYDDRGKAEKSRQCGLEAEQARQCLDALIDEAEAALAYAEYQYQYDKGHGVLAWQQMIDYIGKRNKLWEVFVAARDKAMNQQ